jgi:uncharacterized membrane protein
MKFALISTVYLLGPFLILLLFQKLSLVRKLGTILPAYAVGIVLSLTNTVPVSPAEALSIAKLQENIMNLTVPLAIPLLLFSTDFNWWTHSMTKTLSALLGGIVAVCLAVVLGFMVFRQAGVPDLWKAAGMMTGMYTGGTLNFVAVGQSLHVDSTIYTLFSTFDMVLSFFFLLFIVGGGYRLFRRFLPYGEAGHTAHHSQTLQADYAEKYHRLLRPGLIPGTLVALLLSGLFVGIAAGISLWLTGSMNELVIVLTISTLSLLASFFKPIRKLPNTYELGMFLIVVFSIVVASQFDPGKLQREHLNIVGFIAFVIAVATLLHLLISKITRVPGDLFTVAHVALLYSPPFVPPVAAAMHNRNVLVSGIAIGLIGWAVGTYLGVGLSELLYWIYPHQP